MYLYKECGEYINVDSLFALATKVLPLTGSVSGIVSHGRKEKVCPKKKILSSFTHPHVVLNHMLFAGTQKEKSEFSCMQFICIQQDHIKYIRVELQKSTKNIKINPYSTKCV